jgi:choline-glycine betaine transporter
MGTIAYALVGFAGVDGVRMGYVISGAPMMFIMVAMIVSFFKGTKSKLGFEEVENEHLKVSELRGKEEIS